MLSEFLRVFPKGKSVVILSGGMDSTIALRLAIEANGVEQVLAISFNYNQKQSIELTLAAENCNFFGIPHSVIPLSILGDIAKGVSSNIQDTRIEMPTIQEILGDPAPVTEVPFRNGIMLMIAAAFAQANECKNIIIGVQAQDEYSYFDTTLEFIESMNKVIGLNRQHQIKIHAPWAGINKATEIKTLQEMDGNVNLLKNTITCYNPKERISCGTCPSCAERIANFKKAGLIDPIQYAININW